MIQVADIIPPRLRPGDTVALCAPAGPVPKQQLDAGIAKLRNHYHIIYHPDLLSRDGYLAGTDTRRIAEFNAHLANPDVRAIFVARGGYGSMRILDALDADCLRRDPKLIVGFSDATAILCWARAAGVRAIHGPVVCQLAALEDRDLRWLVDMMQNPHPAGPIHVSLTGAGYNRMGYHEGHLLGGNLCMLAHMVGTTYYQDLTDAIVLLEEVNEQPYAIDRYLTRLALASCWSPSSSAIIGDFVNCVSTNPNHPQPLSVVQERLQAFSVPALQGLPVGHGNQNLALPFGGRCAIDFDQNTFELLEAAVS